MQLRSNIRSHLHTKCGAAGASPWVLLRPRCCRRCQMWCSTHNRENIPVWGAASLCPQLSEHFKNCNKLFWLMMNVSTCLFRTSTFGCSCGLTQTGQLAFDGLKLGVMDMPRLAHHEASLGMPKTITRHYSKYCVNMQTLTSNNTSQPSGSLIHTNKDSLPTTEILEFVWNIAVLAQKINMWVLVRKQSAENIFD